MAQITGNDYLNKYGYLPKGYTNTSMIDDMAPDAKYSPTPTRTVDAGTYVNNVNNPTSYQQQIQDLITQSNKAQQAYLDALAQPYQGPDYSEFLKPLAGPDYSGLQPLIEQSAGLKNQANTFQNTLEDLPQTLQQLYRDTGIQQNQLDRTTAIQSEPIIKSLERLIRASGVLDQQVGQGRELARDQYNVNLQNRQFGLQGLQLQDQSQQRAYDQRLKGLEYGAEAPIKQIGVLQQLESILNPKPEAVNYLQFQDPVTGMVKFINPNTLEVVKELQVGTPQPRSGSGGSGVSIPGFGNVKLTPAQQGAVIDAQNTLGNISQINQLLESGVNTGPLAGTFNNIFGRLTNPSEYRQRAIQLQSSIEQLRANFQKALSGAAVSEQEAKRLAKFLPNINDQESVIRNKLLALQTSLEGIIQNNFLAGGGQYSGFGSASGGADYRSTYGY